MSQPRYAEFPKSEFEERYARARSLMEEQNLDALLITERLNYIYFTGHRSEQTPIDKLRPYVFILPREGEGVLITMEFEREQIKDTTWIENVHPAGLKDRVEPIVTVLKKLKLDRGRIGAELGTEQYLGINYNEFTAVQKALPDAQFVDAAPLILELRLVKSPAEVAYIRTAGQILSKAMAETFENVKSGMTERDVMRVLRTLIAEGGGERVTFMWVVSSQDGMIAPPTNRKIVPGDLIVLDAGVEYMGYASDVSRTAFVGEPPAHVAEFYTWQTQLTRHAVDHLRAGLTPTDVVKAAQAMCEERGLSAGVSGRIGHGVGLASTENPSLALGEPIVFEPGMVFACNPNFFYKDYGWMNNEDDWLVRPDGPPELLSEPIGPEELPIIRTS